jgi:ubiquinone/menaquinone biosynthesis C-methylase UbiE
VIYNKVFEDKDYKKYEKYFKFIDGVEKKVTRDGINGLSTGGVRLWECCHVLRCLLPKKGNVVLDIGSFKGVMPFCLTDMECKIHTIDIKMPNQQFLDYSAKRGITSNQASIYKIPYPNEFFDMAYSICVLEHLVEDLHNEKYFARRIAKAIEEVMRVLKSGGIFASTIDFYIKETNYHIPDPWKYYLENSSVYHIDDERRKEHIRQLERKELPDNLFTCASLVLRKK